MPGVGFRVQGSDGGVGVGWRESRAGCGSSVPPNLCLIEGDSCETELPPSIKHKFGETELHAPIKNMFDRR